MTKLSYVLLDHVIDIYAFMYIFTRKLYICDAYHIRIISFIGPVYTALDKILSG